MTARRLEIFVIVVIIALIGIIYALTQSPVLAPTNETPQGNQQVAASVEYQGVDGRNALDLLKASHVTEVQSFSYGDMVLGIDGVKPDSNHFWAMYVNGQFSQVGAATYITKNTDVIKWVIEEIKY